MRRAAAMVIVVVGASALAAQGTALGTLGVTPQEAEDSIFTTLASGVAAFAGDRAVFKAASGDQRVAMVRAVFAIARTFAATPEFARRYALYRAAQQPQRAPAARTGDQARAQQQEAIDLAVKQAMAGAERLSPEDRKRLEGSIAEMRRQVAELNADPAYRAQVDAEAVAAAAVEDADHARRLAIFEDEFPARVEDQLARRLRYFLLACSDVDFAARLEQAPDKSWRFVNAAHERRSAEWKLCYRAGKPAVAAARAAAEDWLKTLTQQRF